MDVNDERKLTQNTTNSGNNCTQRHKLFNHKYLEAAFKEAEKAIQDNEVPVGCVFVKNVSETELKSTELLPNHLVPKKYEQTIISRGRNTVNATKNATRHAEMNCIDEVHYSQFKEDHSGKECEFYRSVDVYVNVEPCIQCCAALLEIGPPRSIFYGCANDRFGGCGSVLNVPELLGFHNLEDCSTKSNSCLNPEKCILISGGHRSNEAIDLLKTFYKGENFNAPVEKRKQARN